VGRIVQAIPRVARPFALLVVPLLLLHALFMRTPSGVPDVAYTMPQPSTTDPQSTAPVPSSDQVQFLIEHDDSFSTTKHAVCTNEDPYSALCTALQKHEYYVPPNSDFPDVDVTPEAHSALGGDLTVTKGQIDLVVARKIFVAVKSIDPPPQALAPPLQYATRVDFTWKWSATNAVSDDLGILSEATHSSGVAYLQRNPNKEWTIGQITLNGPAPSN
jgi:hypothetical protein